MIGTRLLGRLSGVTATRVAPRSRLNRAPSPLVAYCLPWLSVALASAMPGWPLIASLPQMPPFGFLMLLGWRQLRPGLLPIWAGLPLGLFDDLVSGQPAGSGVLLWSVAMLGLEAIELRWPWRNFLVEWAVATAIIAAYLMLAGFLANGIPNTLAGWPPPWLLVIPPQVAVSVLVYPPIGRLVAWIDRLRLTPFRNLG